MIITWAGVSVSWLWSEWFWTSSLCLGEDSSIQLTPSPSIVVAVRRDAPLSVVWTKDAWKQRPNDSNSMVHQIPPLWVFLLLLKDDLKKDAKLQDTPPCNYNKNSTEHYLGCRRVTGRHEKYKGPSLTWSELTITWVVGCIKVWVAAWFMVRFLIPDPILCSLSLLFFPCVWPSWYWGLGEDGDAGCRGRETGTLIWDTSSLIGTEMEEWYYSTRPGPLTLLTQPLCSWKSFLRFSFEVIFEKRKALVRLNSTLENSNKPNNLAWESINWLIAIAFKMLSSMT